MGAAEVTEVIRRKAAAKGVTIPASVATTTDADTIAKAEAKATGTAKAKVTVLADGVMDFYDNWKVTDEGLATWFSQLSWEPAKQVTSKKTGLPTVLNARISAIPTNQGAWNAKNGVTSGEPTYAPLPIYVEVVVRTSNTKNPKPWLAPAFEVEAKKTGRKFKHLVHNIALFGVASDIEDENQRLSIRLGKANKLESLIYAEAKKYLANLFNIVAREEIELGSLMES
jgi:hypothetical protein